MLWTAGAVCMILFGATLGYIGFALGDLPWSIVGAFLLVVGIFLLVWFRRSATRLRGSGGGGDPSVGGPGK